MGDGPNELFELDRLDDVAIDPESVRLDKISVFAR